MQGTLYIVPYRISFPEVPEYSDKLRRWRRKATPAKFVVVKNPVVGLPGSNAGAGENRGEMPMAKWKTGLAAALLV
jgi:hypothetical protein